MRYVRQPLGFLPGKRSFPQQAVDVLCQMLPVVELVRRRQNEIRRHAFVDVIEGAVLRIGQAIRSRYGEYAAVSSRHVLHHAGAAPRGLAEDRDPMGILQHAGHQIAAGKAVRRGQAEEIVLQEMIPFVKLMNFIIPLIAILSTISTLTYLSQVIN